MIPLRVGTNLIPNRPAYQGQGPTTRLVDTFVYALWIRKSGDPARLSVKQNQPDLP